MFTNATGKLPRNLRKLAKLIFHGLKGADAAAVRRFAQTAAHIWSKAMNFAPTAEQNFDFFDDYTDFCITGTVQ